MESSLQDRIRERAYELWLASGRIDGQAEQHWLAAERQLLTEAAAKLCSGETVREKQAARPKSKAAKAAVASKAKAKVA